MEKEIEKVEFDFNKITQKVIEEKPILNDKARKGLKYSAFLAAGFLAITLGVGLSNVWSKAYLIHKEEQAKIEEIQAQNEEVRKNKQFEIDSANKAKQQVIDAKEEEKKKQQEAIDAAQQEKLDIQADKAEYVIWLKNKDDIIKNYENQIGLYDKSYQDAVKDVNLGVITLDDLSSIRDSYQEYKKDIHECINFVINATASFETFRGLSDEQRATLKEQIASYQSGDLRRNTDLESAFINTVSDTSNDSEDDKKIANLRNTARNQMIDDLAEVMKNNNATTAVKKLKR